MGGRRREPITNMRKDMDEKKRCNAYQADGVTQEPPQHRPLAFTPGNAVIRNQACDTNGCCYYSRRRTHQNIADHISSAAQPKIDLRRTTQHVCRRAVTDSNSTGTDRIAEGHDWLGVNNSASKSIGETGQNRIPWADSQHERHNHTDGGIPVNESYAREENDFRAGQQQE